MQQEEEVKEEKERRRIKVVGKRKEGWNESTREGQEWGARGTIEYRSMSPRGIEMLDRWWSGYTLEERE